MAIELDPIKAAIQPYLLWIKIGIFVLFCATMFGAGWWVNGWRWEGKENRAYEKELKLIAQEREQFLLDKAKWETQSAVDSARIESLDQQKDTLLATLNGLKLTRTIKVQPNAQGECESTVLDDAFRLRWNGTVETAAATASAASNRSK